MFKARKYRELENQLGHKFQDVKLLQRALTHASKRGEGKAEADNERLEFLGDRVLGLAVGEALLEAFPGDAEGELARRFNRLVRRETCAKVGRTIGLGNFMILSDSEAASGGRAKATILADGIEAVLGAVFLDGGFKSGRAVVRRLWADAIGSVGDVGADAKSALQEWAQSRGLDLPQYREVAREGPDHAPHFITEVTIGPAIRARGEGKSKRQAEQAAAAVVLREQRIDKSKSHD